MEFRAVKINHKQLKLNSMENFIFFAFTLVIVSCNQNADKDQKLVKDLRNLGALSEKTVLTLENPSSPNDMFSYADQFLSFCTNNDAADMYLKASEILKNKSKVDTSSMMSLALKKYSFIAKKYADEFKFVQNLSTQLKMHIALEKKLYEEAKASGTPWLFEKDAPSTYETVMGIKETASMINDTYFVFANLIETKKM